MIRETLSWRTAGDSTRRSPTIARGGIRASLDPVALSNEPSLRILLDRPEFCRLLSGAPERGAEESR
jgi:hypothetical protein